MISSSLNENVAFSFTEKTFTRADFLKGGGALIVAATCVPARPGS